jgi:hypothetical protein
VAADSKSELGSLSALASAAVGAQGHGLSSGALALLREELLALLELTAEPPDPASEPG